jgi:methylenetetrahydrofolate reductase (NADPH)
MNSDTSTHNAFAVSVRYELIPLKSVEQAIVDLPAASQTSVTCSPNKGIVGTLDLAERVIGAGHHTVAHIAARMVEGPEHCRLIAKRLKNMGATELFVVAGDQDPPLGPYADGLSFLREFLQTDHGLTTIGSTAYPDGHALIDPGRIHAALHDKQNLILSAGLQSFVSTQMCFDPQKTVTWLEGERRAGLTVPVHLGLPGAVDRTKLITLGARLGIGASVRFLTKNRKSIAKLMSSSTYDPAELINPLAPHFERLNINALHLFTFNEVGATVAWLNATGVAERAIG